MKSNSKNIKIYSGALEKAGLSEVSYFIKKAERNIDYALYSLEGTKFKAAENKLKSISDKLDDMRKMGNDMLVDIDKACLDIYNNLDDEENSEE
jgi:hypothetical protein